MRAIDRTGLPPPGSRDQPAGAGAAPGQSKDATHVHFLVSALRENPELALFLTIALGFLIGKLRFGSFSFGIVVGCLLAGVLVGQLDIAIPPIVKTVFFDLFLFTTGYKVGPQFFRGLRGDALPQLTLTLFLCTACLFIAYGLARLMGYDIGTAAGLLAGAFSESTVIGTAGSAIDRLALPAAERAEMINNIPVAYAVTYLVGTAVLVWFIPNVGPKLMGVDLRQEAERMRAAGGPEADQGLASAARVFDVRAYRLESAEGIGRTIAEVEAIPQVFRAYVLRVRRDGRVLQPAPDMVLAAGDIVAVGSRFEFHALHGRRIGPEVDDRALVDMPVQSLDVVLTNRAIAGRTLLELGRHEFARGVFLSRLSRAGVDMPVAGNTVVDRGDVLRLLGPVSEVERAAVAVGYADRETPATDMIFVGLGIVLGGLVGLLSVLVWGVPLTLTASGGALVGGLVFGWMRSAYPFFGRIPEPAIWIFDTLGLCMFIAVVGITAGPGFVAGLQKTGPTLVLVGLVSAVLPHTLSILFGYYVLRMNPLIVLGACAGAGTITAALRAVQDKAQSNVPALGYTVPYAAGNILLTAWGPVLVAMMSL
jgi:putative transport protein